MSIIVSAIEPDTAFDIWPRVKGMIDIGYEAGGDFMPDDMLERIKYARILLWVAIDDESGNIIAAMTTELVPMRAGLVCWMCQCGGDRMQDWSRFHVQIEEYARKEGCVSVILQGRRGWEKILEGYRIKTVRLEKVL